MKQELIQINKGFNKPKEYSEQSLIEFAVLFHNSQPPNLDLKCVENFEVLRMPDITNVKYSNQHLWDTDREEYQQALTFRQRIDELKTRLTEEIGIGDTLTDQVDKLQAFKDYVHNRLDGERVEKEPNGKHSKHGCRIGDRLDIVFNEFQAITKERDELKVKLAEWED